MGASGVNFSVTSLALFLGSLREIPCHGLSLYVKLLFRLDV